MEFVTLSVSETCGFAMERAVGLQNVSPGGGMAEQHCCSGAQCHCFGS